MDTLYPSQIYLILDICKLVIIVYHYQCTCSLSLFSSIIGVTLLELAVISEDTSVGVGETTLLVCVSFGQPDVDITWSRDGQVISNSSLVSIYEEDLALGDRQFKQSFLQLCGLEGSDSGTYTCTVSSGLSSANSSTELAVVSEFFFLDIIFQSSLV